MAANPNTKRSVGAFARTMIVMTKTMFTPGLDLESYARRHTLAQPGKIQFSADSANWQATHGAVVALPDAG
jgi:hypothetical protein